MWQICQELQPEDIIGVNLRIIAKRINCDIADVFLGGRHTLKNSYIDECSEQDKVTLGVISELRDVFSHEAHVEGFTYDELYTIFDNLCTE